MRISVDGGGYATAVVAFERGNQSAALAYDSLTGKLASYGAMAGDASIAADFAAAYDDAGRDAVAALSDVAESFAACGHLTQTALDNHRRAESRSIFMGSTVYEGGLPDDGYVTVLPASLPSALGGDHGGLPGWANWILDQVEGFVWPDADVDRLRDAAAVWRGAAAQVDGLATYCDAAVRGLWGERSPEIPRAVAAVHELEDRARDLTGEYVGIAAGCEAYADQVEEQRAAILDLVSDLLRDAVIIQGIGLVLGAVTGGATAAGAAAVNAAKIAATAPRFLHFVSLVRLAATTGATSLRSAGVAVRGVRLNLAKFRDVRRLVAEARALRAERATRNARLRATVLDPRRFTPMDLRGLSRREIRGLCKGWKRGTSRHGDGVVYEMPGHRGAQIRVMEGYTGNRANPITHGPYAVVSQNGDKVKIPLKGNPVL